MKSSKRVEIVKFIFPSYAKSDLKEALLVVSLIRPILIATLFIALAVTGLAYADDQDTDTGVSGTDGPDLIAPLLPISVNASIGTNISEKIEAVATGIDSLDGDDTIMISAPTAVTSLSNALLMQTPEKKTESIAKGPALRPVMAMILLITVS